MEIMDIFNDEPRKIKCISNSDRTWGVGGTGHLLEIDKEYSLDYLIIYDWYTEVYLEEFEGVAFNSVLFGEVER